MKYEKFETKLNSSNYGYSSKPKNVSEQNLVKHADKEYSAFANPKGRTLPLAGGLPCGHKKDKKGY